MDSIRYPTGQSTSNSLFLFVIDLPELQKLIGVTACPNCLFPDTPEAWEQQWASHVWPHRSKDEMRERCDRTRQDLAEERIGIGDAVDKLKREFQLHSAHLYERCPFFDLPWFRLSGFVPERLHQSELGIVRWCFRLASDYLHELQDYTANDLGDLSARIADNLLLLHQPVVTRILCLKHGSITGKQYRHVHVMRTCHTGVKCSFLYPGYLLQYPGYA